MDGTRRRRSNWRKFAEWLRPLLLLAALLFIAAVTQPGVVPAFGPLRGEVTRIDEHFSRCQMRNGYACVVDGDTIKLGSERIRLIGIDTPELYSPRCVEEARLAEEATKLLHHELNKGPVLLIADARRDRDKYGRPLRRVVRLDEQGNEVSIGRELIRAGLAEPYLGRKANWC